MFQRFIFVLISVVLGCETVVIAQTDTVFGAKYDSKPFYRVRPRILMSTQKNAGTLCGVTFQPTVAWGDNYYIGSPKIDPEGFAEVIDEVLGSHKTVSNAIASYVLGTSVTEAGILYGNVSIELKKATLDPSVKIISTQTKKVSSLQEFLDSFGPAEIITIWWSRRDGCHDK